MKYICKLFTIGVVEYNVDGFVERNKDVFYTDLIELMQSSQNNLVRKLFPDVIDKDNKKLCNLQNFYCNVHIIEMLILLKKSTKLTYLLYVHYQMPL